LASCFSGTRSLCCRWRTRRRWRRVPGGYAAASTVRRVRGGRRAVRVATTDITGSRASWSAPTCAAGHGSGPGRARTPGGERAKTRPRRARGAAPERRNGGRAGASRPGRCARTGDPAPSAPAYHLHPPYARDGVQPGHSDGGTVVVPSAGTAAQVGHGRAGGGGAPVVHDRGDHPDRDGWSRTGPAPDRRSRGSRPRLSPEPPGGDQRGRPPGAPGQQPGHRPWSATARR